MTTHSRLPPSAAHRWTACPGSVREEAKYPDSDSIASIDGTKDHLLLSLCVNKNSKASDAIGATITGETWETTFIVDKERADRVQVALDYVAEQRKLYGGDCIVTADVHVDPAYLVGRKDLTGTLDICIEAPGVRMLEIIDYKGGFIEVPAEDNEQLELYALGKLSALQIPEGAPYPYDMVRMTIVQPKNKLKGHEPVVGWEVTTRFLLDHAGHYAVAAAATDDPDAPLVPGESQCRWCRAKGSCSALAAHTMAQMGVMFQDLTVSNPLPGVSFATSNEAPVGTLQTSGLAIPIAPEGQRIITPDELQRVMEGRTIEILPSPGPGHSWVALPTTIDPVTSMAEVAASKEPTTLSDDKIRQVLEAAPLLRQFIESVEEEALRRLKGGTAIPGLKVVHGRGSRQWAFPEDDIAAKLLKMGVPKGSVYETKLISPAKAEKLTWEKRDGTAKQLTPNQLKLMNNEYVAKMAGKLTVVPASDERPAVLFDAAPLFKAIEAPVELPAWIALPTWMVPK